jgi:hypothetical protein
MHEALNKNIRERASENYTKESINKLFHNICILLIAFF